MKRKALAWALLAACLGIPGSAWGAGTVSTTVVTVNATVDEIVEWDSATQTINIGTHISAVGQSQSGSVTMALYSNATGGVAITAAGTLNAGILKEAGGDTLTTAYQLNGTGVRAADLDGGLYRTTGVFFGKTYHVDYVSMQGVYQVIMGAQASSPANRAPNAGAYTCSVTLTATSL